MAEPQLLEAGPAFAVAAGEAISRGELVYYSQTNSDYRLAQADGAAESGVLPYASFVALSSAAADGDTLLVANRAVLRDGDNNSYSSSVDQKLYLSATAGAVTDTRPTGATDFKQVVGHAYVESGGTGSQIAVIELSGPKEMTVSAGYRYSTSANALLDSGNFGGGTLDAQNEVALFAVQIPENAVSIEIAYAWFAAEATAGTPTFALTVGGAIDGAQHDAVTADSSISGSAFEGAAADEVQRTDITTALDATDIFRPGSVLGLKFLKDDSGTDISIMIDVVIVFNVV